MALQRPEDLAGLLKEVRPVVRTPVHTAVMLRVVAMGVGTVVVIVRTTMSKDVSKKS